MIVRNVLARFMIIQGDTGLQNQCLDKRMVEGPERYTTMITKDNSDCRLKG